MGSEWAYIGGLSFHKRGRPFARGRPGGAGAAGVRILSVNEIYSGLADLQDIWGLALLLWGVLQVTRQFLGSLHSNATDLRCSAWCMVP